MLEPLYDHGHVILADNFYVGLPLLLRAQARDTYLVGTVRTNRVGFPAPAKVKFKKPKRGDLAAWTTQIYDVNKNRFSAVFVERWFDNKQVTLLSSVPPVTSTAQRRFKTTSTDAQGNKVTTWQNGVFLSSSTIDYYNAGMGGCDRSDQVMSYYLRHMQSKRPYVVLFYYLFLTAANNDPASPAAAHPAPAGASARPSIATQPNMCSAQPTE